MDRSEVKSPCVGICAIAQNELCAGCFRTLEEIAQWNTLPDAAKRKILKEILHRREKALQELSQ
ncbi:MAG: DUF1289 domain-containing protein [Calditrichia bacterium]